MYAVHCVGGVGPTGRPSVGARPAQLTGIPAAGYRVLQSTEGAQQEAQADQQWRSLSHLELLQ